MSLERRPVSFETIESDQSGQRIDNFLSSRLKGLPKSRLYRLLRKGEVRVNKGRIKPEYKLKAGDVVRIPPVQLPEVTAAPHVSENMGALLTKSTIYEDTNWLVMDKPAGIAVHGGSGLSLGLIEAMRVLRDDCRYLELCHRIDKDTSGCLVIAKKRSALRRFHAALRERKITKRYLALVVGRWPRAVDAMNVALEKNVLQSGERMVRLSKDGKPSRTLFNIVQKFEKFTVIEAQPITGRTHQIRVHAKAAGHPIVGDSKYGLEDMNNQMRAQGFKQLFLHAKSIVLPDEDNAEGKLIESEMPEHWLQLLDQL